MLYVIEIKGKCISKDNSKIFNKQGRPFLSKRFKDYAKGVAMQATIQIKKPLEGDLHVTASFYMKNKVHSDLTNLPKGIFDALNKIVWKDDRQIKSCDLRIYYGDEEKVTITVLEMENK